MGTCRYQFNPSELYRRTAPGQAPEVTCGARTFPAVDEPEVATVRVGMGSDGAIYEYRPTGRHIARPTDDPYCPAHGGSAEPPPPPVSAAELDQAYQAYMALCDQFDAQQRAALPDGPAAWVQVPAGRHAAPAPEPAAPGVTAGQLQAAAAQLQALAARAQDGSQAAGETAGDAVPDTAGAAS